MTVIRDEHDTVFSAFLTEAGCFIEKLVTEQAIYHVDKHGLDIARFDFSIQLIQTISLINAEYGGQAGIIVCLNELTRPTQFHSVRNEFFGLYFTRNTVIVLLCYRRLPDVDSEWQIS